MYFDVDSEVEIPKSSAGNAIAEAAREITERRGIIVAETNEVLVFSATWWRFNGIAWWFIKQLPLGVSHGLIEMTTNDKACLIRFRVSLFWLRINLMIFLFLFAFSLVSASTKGHANLVPFFILGIIALPLIYVAEVCITRRSFRNMLLKQGRG